MEILTFYGPIIGSVLARLLRNAVRRIYIMSMTIGHVGTIHIKDRKFYISLEEILKTKAREGVDVSLILKDPNNLNIDEEKKKRYLEFLDDLALAGIQIYFCWHMHMKVMVIDHTVLVGSANLTYTGLRGLGEVAIVINDKRFADSMARTHRLIRQKKHEICLLCDVQEKGICGYFSLGKKGV